MSGNLNDPLGPWKGIGNTATFRELLALWLVLAGIAAVIGVVVYLVAAWLGL